MLVGSLDDEYEVSVVRGAIAAAREHDASLLCVVGGAVGDPNPEIAAGNFAYELVTPANARGLLVLSSSIGNAVGPAGLGEWLGRFAGLSLCCAGVPVAGIPSVTVDNSGLRDAVLHLIDVHDKRRIAFVRGPAASTEAEDRLDAYRTALASRGIAIEPRWITDGAYTKSSGEQAVRTLLDDRRISVHALDAIVAANDFMAVGALAELTRRGIKVPEQIALVGFDDVESARRCRPPLTTVRQPTERIGREGILRSSGAGDSSRESLVLPTELVVRRSCGCSFEATVGLAERAPAGTGRGVESSFVQRRPIIIAELARAARGTLGAAGSGWENRLVDALLAELRIGASGELGRAVMRMLERIDHNQPRVADTAQRVLEGSIIQDVLSALRRHSLPCVAADATARDRLEEALHDARAVAAAIGAEAAARRERENVEKFRNFARSAQTMAFGGSSDLSRLAAERLPALGVDACVVAVFPTPGQPSAQARIAFGLGGGVERATSEIVPVQNLPRYVAFGSHAQIVLPVVLGERPLGVAVLSVAAVDGSLFEDLRHLFGTMLGAATPRAGAG